MHTIPDFTRAVNAALNTTPDIDVDKAICTGAGLDGGATSAFNRSHNQTQGFMPDGVELTGNESRQN